MQELDLIGKTLGNCQILAEIGRGGMGVVYRAFQPSLNRVVAVKVLLHHLAYDPELVQRFLREARTAASLKHPNIVTIYDVGVQDGLYYLVMEYLEGQTLDQLIDREGPQPAARVAHIVTQIANALDHAHSRGLVHRDIKPDNVFVGEGDRVTLTDFGIARAAWDTRLTRTGVLIGTPQYMSPEQARGEDPGPSGDLYALGIVAYRMLGGQVPFDATTPAAVLYKHVHEPPLPIRSRRPDLPPALDRVLGGALAKEPSARYANAGAFAQALAGALGRQPAARPAGPAPRRRAWPWVAAGVIAAALVLIALVLLLPKGEPSGVDAWATAQALASRTATLTVEVVPSATPLEPTPLPAPSDTPSLPGDTPPPSASDTPSPTPTSIPTDTPAPTDTLTPTDTPSPTPTPIPPTPTCALSPDPPLAAAWDRATLGCPQAPSVVIWAAWQPFERGYMIWRDDTDHVYVLYLRNGTDLSTGTWELRLDQWDGSNPDGVGLSPPPGLYEPKRGFGWLWRTQLGGAGGPLGWARDEEKGFCLQVQAFDAGLLLHSSTVEYCQDQLYNWATHPSFTPLFFALYSNGAWRRY